jgi:hypothetical protein
VTQWVVRPWARYGQKRLYATTPGGTDLGYFDVNTGQWHCDDPADLPLLQRAVADYQDGQSKNPTAAPVNTATSADAVVVDVPVDEPVPLTMPAEAAAECSDRVLVVPRWARHGRERLYAETPGGTDLGYLDVQTGEWHCDDPTNLTLLQRVVTDYLDSQPTNPASAESPSDAVVVDVPIEEPVPLSMPAETAVEGRNLVLVLRRWARYGQERLYAATPGGTDLGYLDVKTGEWHCVDPADLPLLQRAVADYRDSRPKNPTAAPADAIAVDVAVDKPPRPTKPAEAAAASRDLALNAPGAEARARAVAERESAPIRTFVARVLRVKTDERAWRIGADGEEAVAAQLAKLGPEWRVLHAVPVGRNGADIDHVVIGPGGVYVINTKHHPNGKIWVAGDVVRLNGYKVPYVRNSRHEARRAARLLSEHTGFPVTVGGIVAIMGAHQGFTIKKQPGDGAVVIVARKEISQYLRSRPIRLTPAEVETIYAGARRSTTWK